MGVWAQCVARLPKATGPGPPCDATPCSASHHECLHFTDREIVARRHPARCPRSLGKNRAGAQTQASNASLFWTMRLHCPMRAKTSAIFITTHTPERGLWRSEEGAACLHLGRLSRIPFSSLLAASPCLCAPVPGPSPGAYHACLPEQVWGGKPVLSWCCPWVATTSISTVAARFPVYCGLRFLALWGCLTPPDLRHIQ